MFFVQRILIIFVDAYNDCRIKIRWGSTTFKALVAELLKHLEKIEVANLFASKSAQTILTGPKPFYEIGKCIYQGVSGGTESGNGNTPVK